MGIPPVLARTREEANLAVRRISRELVWKIHFEKAQVPWVRYCLRSISFNYYLSDPLLHSIFTSSTLLSPCLSLSLCPYPPVLCPSVFRSLSQAEERAADCAALGMYHLAPKCSALKGDCCVCMCVHVSLLRTGYGAQDPGARVLPEIYDFMLFT